MYEIKILTSEEFDHLPYDGIQDSLGIADVRRGKVFVRDTGIHDLNKYLINHEIDHMVEEHATDEDEYGIRHKKAWKWFLPFVGPSLAIGDIIKTASNAGMGSKPKTSSVPGTEGFQPTNQQAVLPSAQNTGTLGQFSVSTPGSDRVSENFGGNPTGSLIRSPLGGGLGSSQIIPDTLRERIRGFYSGRIPF